MKKAFLLFLIILIVFFPPLSVYFAVKTSHQLQSEEYLKNLGEKITADLQQLDRSSDASGYQAREQTKLRQHLEHPSFRIEDAIKGGRLETYLNQRVPEIVSRAGFPCEFEIIVFGENLKPGKRLHYGPSLGLQKITSVIKGELYRETADTWLDFGNASFTRLQYNYASCLADILYRSITKIVIRSEDKQLMLSGQKLGNKVFIFALGDLSEINLQKNQQMKIVNFPPRDYGLAAFSPDWKEPFSSAYFKTRPELMRRIAKIADSGAAGAFNLQLDGHDIFFSNLDIIKNCRFIAAVPLKLAPKKDSRAENFFIAALCILSSLIFKLLIEKIVFNRGPDLSIKVMIPATFLFLVIQPLFASAYLAGEFFHLRYANEKSRIAGKLLSELVEMDLLTFDNANETLNTARGFNSIERIAEYTDSSYDDDDQNLCLKLMKKLQDENGGNRFLSIWFCRGEDYFTGVKWQPTSEFTLEKVDNMVAELFKRRFLEIMALSPDWENQRPDNSSKNQQKELRAEYSRDFFLKIFGADTFYRFRQNSGLIIDINATYKRDQVIAAPISYRNKTYAYAAWHIDKESASLVFPISRITIASESPRIAIFGDEHTIASLKFSPDEVKAAHPELRRVAEAAHLTRSKVSSRIEYADSTLITEAMPANHTYFTVGGSERMKSYQQFRNEIERQVAMFLGAMVFSGAMLAFAGAIYFIWPLRELTNATSEIVRGNFATRIHEDHPDEFAQIGKAFNQMAGGLEEGQVLKSFVSDSVKKEVADSEHGLLAEKAETRVATVIFAAICGFSGYQKNHNAHEVFALLQMLLQAADQATQRFGGEIDKMIEDKIMIVLEHGARAERGVAEKAVQIAAQISDRISAQTGMKVGAGINTGLTVAGIMGAEKARLSRTVVGDPVNLAARLAYEAIKMNGGLVISGELLADLPPDYMAEKLPISTVKGKTQTIEAYRLISRREQK